MGLSKGKVFEGVIDQTKLKEELVRVRKEFGKGAQTKVWECMWCAEDSVEAFGAVLDPGAGHTHS